MERCDKCTARALNEVLLSSGMSLWLCNHHADKYFGPIPADERFSLEMTEIVV